MTKSIINKLSALVLSNALEITKQDTFKDVVSSIPGKANGIIAINNSFILRPNFIKTNKNEKFLFFRVTSGMPDFSEIGVCKPTDFNMDFKFFHSKQSSYFQMFGLEKEIEKEIMELGQLIFFLIGEVVEEPCSIPIDSPHIVELKYDPLATHTDLIVDNGVGSIVINQLSDPASVWKVISAKFGLFPDLNIGAFEKRFDHSFEKLQNEAILVMNMPGSTTKRSSNSFIQQLINSICKQQTLYELALENCISRRDQNDASLRELMRISYNFADDAMKILKLIVSLSDLKGIVLWTTLIDQYILVESIRNLPWIKSDKKPSPDNYINEIKGARNHAFHNLFMFDRTIIADLSGISVGAKKLTIFPSHSQRKKAVAFDYQDREIIEVLSEITRATETVVTLEFWAKNLEVIKAFIKLLESLDNALWLLNNAI